jgi:signal transduction histidine kinase
MVEGARPFFGEASHLRQTGAAEAGLLQQKEPHNEGSSAGAEVAQRSVAMILAQTRAGAATALVLGALFGIIYVPAVGWLRFLAWYAVLAASMFARQRYFGRLVAREGATGTTLHRIAVLASLTGWLGTVPIPLFSHAINVGDLGVLTVITVGWACVAVSVLAVQPRVYALYLAASFATVFLGWMRHVGPRELLMIGVAMCLGAPMLVRLARIVEAQLRDAVGAAQQNAVLVTQLRGALQSQEEAQRARSRFLGAASHDLRQPVQALLFLSDIFRKSTDPARRDAMAQQIVRTGESIDGMFRHLVDFAQIDAGTMKAVVQPVQLERLVAAAVSGYAEKCAARGLRFRLDMASRCTVAADPVLLERMLRNFLDNAFKYSLQGEIALAVRQEQASALVTVSDQGVGMGDEDLAQACNAFFRGRSAAVAEAEGIGLGLAICRHMADLMQVDLQLASRPGSGTTVSMRLPLASDPGPAPRLAGGEAGAALLDGKLVAVVENDRLARDALCAWLLDAGARVAQASSLARLHEVLGNAQAAPDYIIADYRLGEGTGVDAIEAVRAAHGAVPALIITGEADIGERGLPYPVLQKPITPERLLDGLRAAQRAAEPGT